MKRALLLAVLAGCGSGPPPETSKAAIARAAEKLELKELRPGIAETLLALRRADGGWKNSDFYMKEDDPLIASTLALTALPACR